MKTEKITLQVADGTTMNAYTAIPDGSEQLPGLLVFQEAFGVNEHIRDVTRRFAEQGFVAVAPELFHRTAPGLEAGYNDFPTVMPHLQALTPEGLAHDARAAFDWLQQNSRVTPKCTGCVGFCMGGRTSFVANSVLPLQAAISFYGGGIAPALLPRAAQQHAPILMFWGGLDTHIPQDQIQAVTGALREPKKPFVNVEFSDANHGFFCDVRSAYNPEAAQQAWALSLKFFETYLRGARARSAD